VIADETPMGCQLLRKVLGSHRKIEVAASVFSAKDLLAEIHRASVDSLLVNANLQEGRLSGLRAVGELHASHPKLPIIVLCDHAPDDLVVSSFRSGARGLLCRSESIGMLSRCIQAVYKGQIWASSGHLQVLLGALAQAPPARLVNAHGLNLLAEREGQVVSLVADGLTNRDIAAQLGLSEHTVSNYLFRIYNKLGVSNRVELVLYVMKQREQARAAS
jgi:DNA-binding NarL/FixJ family response regulator